MAAAANMGKPCPPDPIWFRQSCELHVTCPCGRSGKWNVGAFARQHRLPDTMRLYELIARLRCQGCGGRPRGEVRLPGYR